MVSKLTRDSIVIRQNKNKDLSPRWEDSESWDGAKFTKQFRIAMEHYRFEFSAKDLKPRVLDWMKTAGWSKDSIQAFKKTKDNRCSGTLGGLAACLLRGMPEVHAGFNEGRDSTKWMETEINRVINEGRHDIDADDTVVIVKPTVNQPSIQERLRDTATAMTTEIEDAIELFQTDPNAFDPKAFKLLSLLRGRQVKAAHARVIKTFYQRNYDELVEAANTKDEQLKEGYSHINKANLKKITLFYSEILAACDMLAQEAKINKKPRAKKPTDKAKVVSKIKYLKQDDRLKLVSVNPQDIIGAQELWTYNVKSRKLGKYVAREFAELGVKGTSIVNYDEIKSVQKTLRKPEEQLKQFKAAGKVQLRKFLDDIKAVDIKLNGRVNEEVILLRIQ